MTPAVNGESQPPPPTFNATVTVIEISAEKESKITGVTLYTGRAEVTREVRFSVGTGQNKVIISGLSSFLDNTTLRVEGKGAGTIQGVTVFEATQPPMVTTSPIIDTVQERQKGIEAAIERCERSRDAVYKYLGTLDAQHVDADKLSGIIQTSEENLEKLDTRIAGLKKELDASNKEMEQEKERLNPPFNQELRKQVEVGVFADKDGEVVLVLKYAVRNATWDATYNARVNTQTKEKPVKLVYQARINQGTGEAWDNVPILLETNTPTYNVNLPVLYVEKLEIKEKPKDTVEKTVKQMTAFTMVARSPGAAIKQKATESESEDMGFGLFDDDPSSPALATTIVSTHSKGAVSTTYKVPGLVTIPSDNNGHDITIVELELDAVLSWVAVPKLDVQAHLQAKIKNTSDYILLSGDVNIYVDGSFNSKSILHTANPQEAFNFSLGLDPAVRITYHPCVERSSQSGLINKTATKICTQRITVQNTKLVPIPTLKIIDGIPISKDARVTVKLKNPDLALPGLASTVQRAISIGGTGSIKSGSSGSGISKDDGKKSKKLPIPTKVLDQPTVFAQWHGADEESIQVDALGQDGRLNWIISDFGSMEVVNLTLTWEVAVAEGLQVVTNRVYHTQ